MVNCRRHTQSASANILETPTAAAGTGHAADASCKMEQPEIPWELQELAVVLPEHILTADNFDKWAVRKEGVLRRFGVWTGVNSQHDSDPEGDTTKAFLMNIFVIKSISEGIRQSYLLPRPMSGSELLRLLKEPPKPFRLMDLPEELRIKIYECIVVEKQDDDGTAHRVRVFDRIRVRGWGEIPVKEGISPKPSLLQTCRQVRQEASKVYYQQNHFEGIVGRGNNAQSKFEDWARRMNKEDLKNLREFTLIETGYFDEHGTFTYVKSLPRASLTGGLSVKTSTWSYYRRHEEMLHRYNQRMAKHGLTVDKGRVPRDWETSVAGFLLRHLIYDVDRSV